MANAYLVDPYVTAFPELIRFWEAASAGTLLIPHCSDCHNYHWHPRIICPYCYSLNISWRYASGRGKVYSYTKLKAKEVETILAYVQLEEGPIIMTNVMSSSSMDIAIDSDVKVEFVQTVEGRNTPKFRLC